jgi:hypothetical protein
MGKPEGCNERGRADLQYYKDNLIEEKIAIEHLHDWWITWA